MRTIQENYASVMEMVTDECVLRGRNADEIKLVCVSKTVEVPRILQAKDAGALHFGENRIAELNEKQQVIEGVHWHLIGHIQKNKVKHIDNVCLIHSLDSLELAKLLNEHAKAKGIIQDCLLQVKVSEEPTKSGVALSDVDKTIYGLNIFENLCVKGLMTIAPYGTDSETARPYFARLRSIFEKYAGSKTKNFSMEYLSMGMTGDFRGAVAEGANILRIGSAIFGVR